MKKKITMVVSLLLVMALSIGGTLAYLTDKTEAVTNTFTLGNVNITLTETFNTDTDGNQENDAWSAKFVPGKEMAKDPKVTVVEGSEACYIYVKVDEVINFDENKTGEFAEYFAYDIKDTWTELEGEDGVYYMTVDAETAAAGEVFYVLAGSETNANGCVTVPGDVTKTMIDDLNGNPTLTFTAYAVQSEGMADAADAWDKAGF